VGCKIKESKTHHLSFNCVICGKEFQRSFGECKRRQPKCCSQTCKGKYLALIRNEKRNRPQVQQM